MSIVDLPLFITLTFGIKSFSRPITQFPYLLPGLVGEEGNYLNQAYMSAWWTAKAKTLY